MVVTHSLRISTDKEIPRTSEGKSPQLLPAPCAQMSAMMTAYLFRVALSLQVGSAVAVNIADLLEEVGSIPTSSPILQSQFVRIPHNAGADVNTGPLGLATCAPA